MTINEVFIGHESMKSNTEAWMITSHILNLERRAMTVYLLVEGQVLSSVQNGTGGLQYIKPGKDKKNINFNHIHGLQSQLNNLETKFQNMIGRLFHLKCSMRLTHGSSRNTSDISGCQP